MHRSRMRSLHRDLSDKGLHSLSIRRHEECNAGKIHVPDYLEQSMPIAFGAVVNLPAETLHTLDRLDKSRSVAFGAVLSHSVGTIHVLDFSDNLSWSLLVEWLHLIVSNNLSLSLLVHCLATLQGHYIYWIVSHSTVRHGLHLKQMDVKTDLYLCIYLFIFHFIS